MDSKLEHVNVTVTDPQTTASWLSDVFGWRIRWKGAAIHGGTTFHVGGDDSYIAIYSRSGENSRYTNDYRTIGGLNHIAVTVGDLDATEKRVLAQGFKTHSHAAYEPGRRFYFHDDDGIEYEVVSYSGQG